MVFHNLDNMSSLALHLFPQIAMWNLKWYTIPYEANLPAEERHFVTLQDKSLDFYKFFLVPLGFYYSWVTVYYLINFVLAADRIKRLNYENMWVYYSKKEWFNKFMSKFKYPGIIFVGMHFVFWTICHCWALLCYKYYLFNTFAVLFMLSSSIWNSAGYYFSYFSKKYEANLKKMEEVETKIQEKIVLE